MRRTFSIRYFGGGILREDIWYAKSKGEASRCAKDEYRQTYSDFRLISINETKLQ